MLWAVLFVGALGGMTVETLHGSGTTNPSKYIWKVMSILEERAAQPVRMTYRAVGSGTGQFEFVGEGNTPAFTAYTDFGSGDIPMPASEYSKLPANTMVHVPFVLGAVSFFHSVPNPPEGGLRVTPCLLSGIFQGNITKWDDRAILAENSGWNAPSQSIKAARRVHGSSSTALMSQYLQEATTGGSCPTPWVLGVGKGGSDTNNKPTKAPWWPDHTLPAQGSSGMASFLDDNEYSIAYIDSGHGHQLKLQEIELQNLDGTFLNSQEADVLFPANAASFNVPAPTADWSGVSLVNKPGAKTWPMTAMSYFYVRRDHSGDGETGALLKAFLEFVVSPEGQDMVGEFGFERIPQKILDAANAAIGDLSLAVAPWVVETSSSTQKGVGAGLRVFSGKRRAYEEYALGTLQGQAKDLKEIASDDEEEMEKLRTMIQGLKAQVDSMKSGGGGCGGGGATVNIWNK